MVSSRPPATSLRVSAAPCGIPARNVGMGKDHTLFALVDGKVQFATKAKGRTYISVVPTMEAAAE